MGLKSLAVTALHRAKFSRRILRLRFPEVDDRRLELLKRIRAFTMTSPERVLSLCSAVEYVVQNNIPGDFVECGVWKGGSSMAAALEFLRLGEARPAMHLFDTFEGMTPPTVHDRRAIDGASAKSLLEKASLDQEIWCRSGLNDVRTNLLSTGYPEEKLHLVRGRVEDTIPQFAPEQISLLRLDTDWYASTRHELAHLFPRLSVGGVLIVDDYGHWTGAKTAVDEYIAQNHIPILLNRIDYTGRICVKIEGQPFAIAGRANTSLARRGEPEMYHGG